jgi:hypothetical protein
MQVNRGRLEHKASKVDTPFDPSSVKIVDLIGMPHAITEELRDYVSSSFYSFSSPIATSHFLLNLAADSHTAGL